jgi:hypothetical protein
MELLIVTIALSGPERYVSFRPEVLAIAETEFTEASV